MKSVSHKIYYILFPSLFFIACCVGSYIYFYNQPNESVVAPEIQLQSWVIVNDDKHNAFPDMIFWRGYFYLAYRSAKNHIDRHSSIIIRRSTDAKIWNDIAKLSLDDEDIRDPKFAVFDDQLFLYALKNKGMIAYPYTTIFTRSLDGETWTEWKDVSPKNWVFWRPKTHDGKVWYVAADDREEKRSALFSSSDGIAWRKISTIYSGEFHAEIELAFAKRDLYSTVRVEGIEGNPRTLVGYSRYPYTEWELISSYLTRLDGPSLFLYKDSIFAAGRYEPTDQNRFRTGSLLSMKRTSLFAVSRVGLTHLTDLPSSGDTSYPAVVVVGEKAYIVYYTNDPSKDYPWILGQLNPTQLRMAVIDLDGLRTLANTNLSEIER